uniref:Putative secreted peptide n=1 Tax=Anopheles braziliensis TaxID=58242 RepID=A0A2M3ZNM5_9DIPT
MRSMMKVLILIRGTVGGKSRDWVLEYDLLCCPVLQSLIAFGVSSLQTRNWMPTTHTLARLPKDQTIAKESAPFRQGLWDGMLTIFPPCLPLYTVAGFA